MTRGTEMDAGDRMLLLPVALGALVPIGMTRGLGDLDFGTSLIVTFILFVSGAIFAAAKVKSSRWLTIVLMFGGIAGGVVVDAIIDFAFFARDRNLFPFEVVYWWLLGVLPIGLGVILGHLLARRRTEGGAAK